MKPSLAYPCQTLCLTIHIENSEICVAVTNRIWRGFELRSTCDHSTIRWLPVVVLWGINLSNVNFPEKLCSCDVGTEFSIIALTCPILLWHSTASQADDTYRRFPCVPVAEWPGTGSYCNEANYLWDGTLTSVWRNTMQNIHRCCHHHHHHQDTLASTVMMMVRSLFWNFGTFDTDKWRRNICIFCEKYFMV